MKYEEFMDYYLAISIGLDRHSVVNIYGSAFEGVIDNMVYSDSPEDNMFVIIDGLDEGYNRNVMEVELRGASPVDIGEFHKINCMHTDGINQGTIFVGDYRIKPKKVKSQYSDYTIPAGHTGFITNVYGKDVSLQIKETEFMEVNRIDGNFCFKVPFKVTEMSDIRLVSAWPAGIQVILIEGV